MMTGDPYIIGVHAFELVGEPLNGGERLTLVDHLRELGELAPREPVRVVVRIKGKLQWVIEDNSWVEPGDELYVLDDDEALQEVAELRQQREWLTEQQTRLEQTGEETWQDVRSEAVEGWQDVKETLRGLELPDVDVDVDVEEQDAADGGR